MISAFEGLSDGPRKDREIPPTKPPKFKVTDRERGEALRKLQDHSNGICFGFSHKMK